jgi:hypothetical protein
LSQKVDEIACILIECLTKICHDKNTELILCVLQHHLKGGNHEEIFKWS